jgi:hypothetical protein
MDILSLVPSPRVSGVYATGGQTLFYSRPNCDDSLLPPYPHQLEASLHQNYQSFALFTEHRLTPSDRCLICFSDRHRNLDRNMPKCRLQRWFLCGKCVCYQ